VPGHVIGVDIGTTATKAVVFDLRGRVVAHRAVGYPLSTPVPGTAVQDPDAIHRAGDLDRMFEELLGEFLVERFVQSQLDRNPQSAIFGRKPGRPGPGEPGFQ